MKKYLDHTVHYRAIQDNGDRFRFYKMTYVRATEHNAEMLEIPVMARNGQPVATAVLTACLLEAGIISFSFENGDVFILSPWQALMVMDYIKEQRTALRSRYPKTLAGWRDSGLRTIEEYLVVGDQVDVDMVDYFRNILPPRTDRHTLMQAGGEYNTAQDESGSWHPTYLTFETTGDGWRYAGLCYAGERENRVDYKSSLDRRIEAVRAVLVAQSGPQPAE